jgi:hypothetical protein
VSVRHRLRRLEHATAQRRGWTDPADQRVYDAAWARVADAIAATMSPEHLGMAVDVNAAIEAAGDMAPWRVPNGPALRLLHAMRSRVHDRIGTGPELGGAPRWPDSPPALPPVVAEVYMRADSGVQLHALEGRVCADCHYMVPTLSRHELAERDPDGVWRYMDGQLASADRLVIDRKQHRYFDPIDTCPLCGGDTPWPANWYDGLGVLVADR